MKFKKKPVEIEAYQWFKDTVSEDVILLDKEVKIGDFTFVGKIRTLEDTDESCHYVRESDWIITGIAGEKYACKDSIFKDTYDLIEEPVEPHFNS